MKQANLLQLAISGIALLALNSDAIADTNQKYFHVQEMCKKENLMRFSMQNLKTKKIWPWKNGYKKADQRNG